MRWSSLRAWPPVTASSALAHRLSNGRWRMQSSVSFSWAHWDSAQTRAPRTELIIYLPTVRQEGNLSRRAGLWVASKLCPGSSGLCTISMSSTLGHWSLHSSAPPWELVCQSRAGSDWEPGSEARPPQLPLLSCQCCNLEQNDLSSPMYPSTTHR